VFRVCQIREFRSSRSRRAQETASVGYFWFAFVFTWILVGPAILFHLELLSGLALAATYVSSFVVMGARAGYRLLIQD